MAMAISAVMMIKPSSPTPPHLRNYRLSLLDQTALPCYYHVIFYFSPSDHLNLDSNRTLKQSLADALAIYYPFAGRLQDDETVECNDIGVEYSEVKFSDERISDVVEKIEERTRYVPIAPSGGGDIPLAIQVSLFDCSRMAIGVCVWHKLADARSILDFVNKWAVVCRGDLKIPTASNPRFDLASRFPPMERSRFSFTDPDKNFVTITKRVVFNSEKIEELKATSPRFLNFKLNSFIFLKSNKIKHFWVVIVFLR